MADVVADNLTVNQALTKTNPNQISSLLGNVVIGTSAPNPTPIGELHVCSVSTTSGTRGITSAQYSDSVHAAVIALRKARGPETSPQPVLTGDNIGNIAFVGYGSTFASRAQIIATVGAGASGDIIPTDLRFLTMDSLGALQDRMRITSAGNVGVGGTTLPAGTKSLSVHSGAAAGNSGWLRVGQAVGNSLDIGWYYNSTPGSAYSVIATYGYSNPLRIDASILALQSQGGGNVGIGTTQPGMKLAIAGDNNGIELAAGLGGKEANAGKVRYRSGAAGAAGETGYLNIIGSGAAPGARSVRIWDRLLVGSMGFAAPAADGQAVVNQNLLVGGNAGIGTASPQAKLHVSGGAVRVGNRDAIDSGGYALYG